jgi:lipopolysaccharide exporter
MLKKRAASFWLNAMFYTMLQRVSLFAFGVAGYMILVRGFSTQTNGIWALYITIFSLFEMVKQGLLRNPTIRFLGMHEYQFRKEQIQSSSLFINTVFSLLAICSILFFGRWIAAWLNAPDLYPLLIISSFNILLLIPYSHCEILLQADYRFSPLFSAAFIRQATFFAGMAILFFAFDESFTLINVLGVQIIGVVVGLGYLLGKCRSVLLQRFNYSAPLTLSFFHFSKYTFGTNLFSGLSRNFDHFVTAAVLGPLGKTYVAYYNTVARIHNMIDVPSLAAADVLYPKNVEAHENEGLEKVKYYFEQITGTIVAFIVPLSIAIFLLPKFIIVIVAGQEYLPAVPILQITILFSMVRPLSYQFGSTLDAVGKPDVNFIANALLMLFNFAAMYFFLTRYGGIGGAYAIVLYYITSFTVMVLILKKYINIRVRNIIGVAMKRYRDLAQLIKNQLTT